MRKYFFVALAVCAVTAPAMAQNSVPAEIGNRANGFDYQPTPGEIVPREKAAGIQPSAEQQRAANRDLERIDEDLMREEGLSDKSVPKLTEGQN
jgi:peptidoglycan hydrolase CwlO-like protein